MNIIKLIPISTTPLLLLMLFIPSREFLYSNFSYIGLNNLGDDAIAIIFFILINIYTYFSKNNRYRFWIGLNSTLGTSLFIFPDLLGTEDTVNPVYLGVMTLVYIVVLLSFFGQSDLKKIFTKNSRTSQQLLGISGIMLTFIMGFFSMQPSEKTLLKAVGTNFEKSGTNTHSYLSPEFSEQGLDIQIVTLLSILFLLILFTIQVIGIIPSPISYLPILLWFILEVLGGVTSLGTKSFEPSDSWSQQDIAKFNPTETTTGTLEFFIFSILTLLIIVNVLISFVLESGQNKQRHKEENK